MGAIHSTKISGNFGPKLNGSVWSNRKSFEKTGPPFEVDHFSRSDRLEFWLNGSHPIYHAKWTSFLAKLHSLKELCRNIVFFVEYYGFPEAFFKNFLYKLSLKNCLTSKECNWQNTISVNFHFLVWKCQFHRNFKITVRTQYQKRFLL